MNVTTRFTPADYQKIVNYLDRRMTPVRFVGLVVREYVKAEREPRDRILGRGASSERVIGSAPEEFVRAVFDKAMKRNWSSSRWIACVALEWAEEDRPIPEEPLDFLDADRLPDETRLRLELQKKNQVEVPIPMPRRVWEKLDDLANKRGLLPEALIHELVTPVKLAPTS